MADQKIYIAGYFPDDESEKAGVLRVATSFNAKDIVSAKAKANYLFLDEYEHAQSAAFKTLVCEDATGVPRPSRGVWDQKFLNTHDWPEDIGHPVKRQAEKVDFEKLSRELQIASLIKYGSTELTKSDLPGALEITQDDDSFEGHMYAAIIKTPEVANMFHEHIENAIGWLGAKCDHTAKWPEIQKELANWKKRRDGERKQTGSTKSVVDIARERAANAIIAAAPHNDSESSQERPERTYKHTHQTLDQEIANALWPGDVNPGNVAGEIYRWAKSEVIAKDREDWKRISMALRTTENVLKYDLLTIRDVVQNRPEDIHKDPARLNDYISKFLSTNGVFEDAAGQGKATPAVTLDPTAATPGTMEQERNGADSDAGTLEDTPQVERTGPFYFLFADGEKVGRANKLPGLEKALADGAKEISQEEYTARKNGTYEAPDAAHTTSGADNQPEVTNHGAGRFSIDGLMSEQQPSGSTQAISSEDSESQAAAPVAHVAGNEKPEFTLRADELEKELGDSDNISLWKGVMRTNPRYTKDMGDLGFGGTAINAEYMIMRATEKFGPVGIGWGWEILEDKMIEGAPLTEKIFEGTKFVGKRILRDADGSLMFELNHYIRIGLWYIKDGKKGIVENFGSTPYRQTTKNGIFCDSEVHKKSLTDAIKKCLSGLGFCADVWLGLYDDAAYKAESVIEFGLKDATDKAEDSTRIREELDERFKQNVETMRNAVSQNEVSKIASSLTRAVSIHLKAAKEINDKEYVKYLEGRLRRLEDIKGECLIKLEEKA